MNFREEPLKYLSLAKSNWTFPRSVVSKPVCISKSPGSLFKNASSWVLLSQSPNPKTSDGAGLV